jgi:predicted AlkP superfamily phosphohydrolase/phosphomutase
VNDGKVFIFGLDGGTYDYIDPLMEKGKLPTIQGIVSAGVRGNLKTTVPPITGSAWPSFMTGKMPVKHGVFDFIQQQLKKDVSLVNSRSIDGETLFDVLSWHNRKVISINVPVTYPPWKINGIMITGMLSPEGAEYTYPPEMKHDLGEYRIGVKTSYKEGREQEMIDDLEDLLRRRTKLTKRLLTEHTWDFGMVVFRGVDLIPHYFRKHMDRGHPEHKRCNLSYSHAIANMYQKTDEAMADVMRVIPEGTTIFMMSDHGHGRMRKIINLNIWFLNNGFLALKETPKVSLKYNLFRLGFSPQSVYNTLSRLGVQNIIQRFSRQTRNKILNSMLSFTDVDWRRTRAYSLGHIGQIYVNVKGREPFGIIHRGDEYERVRDDVIRKLKKLKDPETGEYVIDEVKRKEAIYDSNAPYFDRSPDLFVFTKNEEYDCFALMAQNTDVFCEHFKRQTGKHTLCGGIFAAHGPAIVQGKHIMGAEIIDIAPTVLYTMGLPIPDDMDGTVLDIFLPEFRSAHKVEYEQARHMEKQQTGIEGEQEEIRERLKNLGYLG